MTASGKANGGSQTRLRARRVVLANAVISVLDEGLSLPVVFPTASTQAV